MASKDLSACSIHLSEEEAPTVLTLAEHGGPLPVLIFDLPAPEKAICQPADQCADASGVPPASLLSHTSLDQPIPAGVSASQPSTPTTAQHRLSGKLQKDIAQAAEVRQMRGFKCAQPRLDRQQRCDRLRALREWTQPEQRSPEWYKMREGMLTASDFQKALTSDASRKSFALDKADPRPFRSSSSPACQHGVVFEGACTKVYERLHDVKVEEFGLLQHERIKHVGASPDGICNEDSADDEYVARAVEFKAPYSRQIKAGEVPTKYLAQIQGQLEVMGLPACDYLECDFATCEGRDAAALRRMLAEELHQGKKEWRGGADGVLCGVVFLTSEDQKKWEYSDAVEGIDQLQAAIDASELSSSVDTKLWALRDRNLVTVYHNREWFGDRLEPGLDAVWRQVEAFRADPELISAARAKSKRSGRQPAFRKAGYSFV